MKNNKIKVKLKNNVRKIFKMILVLIPVFVLLKILSPDRFSPSLKMSSHYAKDMVMIFPAVLIIMGLADVWIPAELVKKYLGQQSGLKGKAVAIILGSLPTGPMYIAFPLAAELIKKKASISNIIIFLGVWASLKIPQIGVEIQFLGIKFAIWRFIFTLISVLMMGLFVEKLVDYKNIKKSVVENRS